MFYHTELLSEQLRPQTLADLNQPDDLIVSFKRMVERQSIPNMLFYGKPGIGKTSAARILLKEINANIYELNGSTNKGDKTMLNDIECFASSISLEGHPKVCFIDEADYMSNSIQAPLRYMIEKFSANTRFLLTANELERLSPAIQSRCMPINFDVFPMDVPNVISRMVSRYHERIDNLGCKAERDKIHKIVSLYFPDLRMISNQLERAFR
jgi:replication factor C small subunit